MVFVYMCFYYNFCFNRIDTFDNNTNKTNTMVILKKNGFAIHVETESEPQDALHETIDDLITIMQYRSVNEGISNFRLFELLKALQIDQH